ncbi:MAG: hypothetical protein AMXMBFR58_11200 [Phycisphaerae bacterium]
MTSPRADALLLVFTAGVSLRQWVGSGLLGREWPLYQRLRADYGRLVIVSYGDADDLSIVADWEKLTGDPSALAPQIICNAAGESAAAYAGRVPVMVAEKLAGCRSVLVKTNQMQGGDAAVRIVHDLRAAGMRVGLVGRGGYLWSRFVAFEHGPESRQAADAAAAEGELCRASDVIIGTTQRMLEDLAWRYSLDNDRLHLVPNYVLASEEPASASSRDRHRLLYAGQLVRRKRVDVLIEAVAAVRESGVPDVVLEIIGEGPEEQALRELTARLNAPVKFRSRVNHAQLIERMSQCAIYVQASELEGHPKTVLEAMATGAAVVVADSPGLAEVVQIGATGLRVPCDAASFAHAITQLLSDEDWRDTLGFAASRAARDSCSLDRVISLERAAHDAAMHRAGQGAAPAPPPVRFDPTLVNLPPDQAAAAFARSIESFLRRNSRASSDAFLASLEQRLHDGQRAAVPPAHGA